MKPKLPYLLVQKPLSDPGLGDAGASGSSQPLDSLTKGRNQNSLTLESEVELYQRVHSPSLFIRIYRDLSGLRKIFKIESLSGRKKMRKLLPEKEKVFHLHEYAVWEGEDEFYGYMSWDDKEDKLTWISGKGMILEDVLCLTSIASEGEEETFKTKLDVEFELNQLPKWDKTKYYCIIVGGEQAVLPQYCETGKRVKKGEEDYDTVKEMLSKHGATLQ